MPVFLLPCVPCSIAPFSTQLTSLSLLDGGSNVDFAWPLAFLPQTPSHTLTHFNTNYYLEPPLLTALLDHAPALTHLSVSNIDLESQSFAHRQWCVECISTGGVDESIRDIVLLPVRASGQIRIETDEWEQELSVSSAQVIAERVLAPAYQHLAVQSPCSVPMVALASWLVLWPFICI